MHVPWHLRVLIDSAWFFSGVSFQEWSCTWSHCPFSAASTGQLDDSSVSWPGIIWSWGSRREVQEQSQPHTPWWPRKEENPSPILNSCEFRNIRKFAGTLWKDKNILWVIGGSEQRRTLKAFPVTFSLNFKVQALGHLLLLFKRCFDLFFWEDKILFYWLPDYYGFEKGEE